MKKLNFIVVLCLVLAFTLFSVACNDSPVDTGSTPPSTEQPGDNTGNTGNLPEEEVKTPVSITVDELPAVIYYGLNETPQWQGIRIVARYEDGTTKLIPFTDCDFSEVDMSTYGKKIVSVSYMEVTAQFDVYVMQNVDVVPGSAEETEYLHENSGSGVGGENDRFADGQNYFIYKFTAGERQRFREASIGMTIRNEYVVAVSFNDIDYTVIAEGATGADRIDFADLEISLNEYVDFSQNTGDLYFKFYDGVTADGFGVSLKAFNIHYLTAEYDALPAEETIKDVSVYFETTTDDETKYLLKQEGTGTSTDGHARRWMDNNAYAIYAFELGKEIKTASLEIEVENETKIEVSFDGETWLEIANSVMENANDCGRYFSNQILKKDVEVTENAGKIYVRFSDADTVTGFGCCLHNVTVKAEVVAFDENTPSAHTLSFGVASADEATYLYSESGSGTVENEKRWADNDNYFIYKIECGSAIIAATLSLVIENQAKIEVSFDGETWVEIANSVKENANDCGKYFSNVASNFNVPITENNGVMYVRFTDADTLDGFGCCLYSFSAIITY